jgi:hypothetical protein
MTREKLFVLSLQQYQDNILYVLLYVRVGWVGCGVFYE